ncbi:UbiX family flavin prenyltransferase [Comamonas testosteroni]|uniref:UbiX family flavin prenyltransferase n=1 Tax=Comamonas testosteroni TaxID=285 RepID=UPI0015F982E9|nr:UbiX family flavin prenyltransferase [Comamonas testosteroni]
MSIKQKKLIIGVSGATGINYALCVLQALREVSIETHLVVTKPADMTIICESAVEPHALRKLASFVYPINDIGASIASGSFKTDGMLVIPCSMRSLAEIATGVTTNLLTRAADVCLKERRRVVLAVRETPLHAGHLKNMLAATEMGAVIAPPVPAFYTKPTSIDEIVNHTVGRLLDLFDIETDLVKRWIGRPRSHQ